MSDRRLPTIQLFLHLTRNCNLRCTYCYTGKKRRDDMSLRVGKDAIDFFLPQTDRLLLQFFGGEPLLKFDLLRQIVAYAQERAAAEGTQVIFVIVTNGTLFTDEVAEFCTRHQIDVSLSLDGNQQAQDANRVYANGRGSFSQIEKNLDRLLATGRIIHVVSVVNPRNVEQLVDSMRFLLARGLRNVALCPDFTHEALRDSLPEFDRQLGKLAALYVDYVRRGERLFLDVFDDGRNPHNRGRCQFGRRDFSVDPSGRIYPCCCFVDHDVLELGNVRDGIDPAKAADFAVELARLHRHLEEQHRDCPEASFCHRGCGCTNIVAAGCVSRVNPVTCELGALIDRHRSHVLSELQHLPEMDGTEVDFEDRT